MLMIYEGGVFVFPGIEKGMCLRSARDKSGENDFHEIFFNKKKNWNFRFPGPIVHFDRFGTILTVFEGFKEVLHKFEGKLSRV